MASKLVPYLWILKTLQERGKTIQERGKTKSLLCCCVALIKQNFQSCVKNNWKLKNNYRRNKSHGRYFIPVLRQCTQKLYWRKTMVFQYGEIMKHNLWWKMSKNFPPVETDILSLFSALSWWWGNCSLYSAFSPSLSPVPNISSIEYLSLFVLAGVISALVLMIISFCTALFSMVGTMCRDGLWLLLAKMAAAVDAVLICLY